MTNNLKNLLASVVALKMEPAERYIRQLIVERWDDLHKLRIKGFTWRQLADVLADCGIQLPHSTLRMYYTEILEYKMVECQRRFSEQLEILAKLEKVVGNLSSETAALIKKQQHREDRNLNERVPSTQKQNSGGQHTELPVKRAAIEPASALAPEPVADPSGEYGLTVAATAPVVSKPGKPAFMGDGDDDAPGVPVPDGDKDGSLALPKIFRCLPLQSGVKTYPKRAGVNPLVYDSNELMEHPAIDGLMLSKAERQYGAFLEYADADVVVQIETIIQKNQRIKWERPFKAERSSTEDDFVEMDMTLFKPD